MVTARAGDRERGSRVGREGLSGTLRRACVCVCEGKMETMGSDAFTGPVGNCASV